MMPNEEVTDAHNSISVPQALGRLRVALDDAYRRSSREFGLTAPQAELLCAALQPTPVRDLATVLRCDRSNVTRLVDRTAKRGLILRGGDDHDGRISVIELSSEGRQLTQRFVASLAAQVEPLLAGWSEQRRTEAVAELNQIADALDGTRSDNYGSPKPSKRSSSPVRSRPKGH